MAARLAEEVFLTPPPSRSRAPAALLAAGHRFEVADGTHRLAVWSWADGPTVLLQHGWGSRADHLAALVPPLLEAGFSVVAPDAPGHGDSSGRTSSVVDFARALRAVAHRVRPLHGIVAHSMGAGAASWALFEGLRDGLRDGLRVERAVFLAPAASLTDVVARFSAQLDIAPWVAPLVQGRIERRLGVPMSALEASRVAQRQTAKLLVFHDPDDREVPWHGGAAIVQAWPGARMETTRGLGHHRLVRDPQVIAEAVRFLADR